MVKGGKVKKEQLKNLNDVITNTGFKLIDSKATEFEVDWTAEKPVAKIWMEL